MRDLHHETVESSDLRPYLDDNRWSIDVRYPTRELALRVDCLQGRALARMRMVSGRVVNGKLRYLVLTVPKTSVVRALRMDPPKPGEISKAKPDDLRWVQRADRAKCGIKGGMTVMRANMYQRVTDRGIERRVVA